MYLSQELLEFGDDVDSDKFRDTIEILYDPGEQQHVEGERMCWDVLEISDKIDRSQKQIDDKDYDGLTYWSNFYYGRSSTMGFVSIAKTWKDIEQWAKLRTGAYTEKDFDTEEGFERIRDLNTSRAFDDLKLAQGRSEPDIEKMFGRLQG